MRLPDIANGPIERGFGGYGAQARQQLGFRVGMRIRVAMPLKIKSPDHLVLRVRDLQGMIAFYTGVLGLTVERR